MNPNKTFDEAFRSAREMLKNRRPGREILEFLVGTAEKVAPEGSVASILALDGHGLLRNAASPKLPADYLRAIDGLLPSPGLGTCASAAATGNVVITPDFCSDDKWAELRHLPLSIGFQGAWSTPIKSSSGHVLGTFGVYFKEKRIPTNEEISANHKLALIAADVLQMSETAEPALDSRQ